MKINNLIRQIPLAYVGAVGALIEVAANMKGPALPFEQLDCATLLSASTSRSILEAAAKMLVDASRVERLQRVENLLDDLDDRSGSYPWITQSASEQVVGLLGTASSVRFAFGSALRPCLDYAVRAAEAGHPVRLQFNSVSPSVCLLAKRLATLFEVDNSINLRAVAPWVRAAEEDFEAELILPPFGLQIKELDEVSPRILSGLGMDQGRLGRLNVENVSIVDALEHSWGARVIIGVTDGALFRMVGAEPIMRRSLLDSGRLKAVLSVRPGLMFTDTMIRTNLLVLAPKADAQERVRFIDLGHKSMSSRGSGRRFEVAKGVSWSALLSDQDLDKQGLVRDVTKSEIDANNRVLIAERYLNTGSRERLDAFLAQAEVVPLWDVAELVRPISLRGAEDGDYTIHEANPGDIDARGFLGSPSRIFSVDRAAYNKAFNQQLRPGDIVLSTKGAIGFVGLVPDDVPGQGEDEIWTAGQSFMILRPKRRGGISPVVLFEYLSNDTVQEFIRSIAGGTAIQSIAMKDLKEFPVPVPRADEMQEAEQAFHDRQELFAQIAELQAQIGQLCTQSWPHKQIGKADS